LMLIGYTREGKTGYWETRQGTGRQDRVLGDKAGYWETKTAVDKATERGPAKGIGCLPRLRAMLRAF